MRRWQFIAALGGVVALPFAPPTARAVGLGIPMAFSAGDDAIIE